MAKQRANAFTLLGHEITPETVREVIGEASSIQWGTHLLR